AFSLVAIPWLVIHLTDSTFVLGVVVAVAAIPRVLFLLIGGTITDRFSPYLVLTTTKLGYGCLTAGLALIILSGNVQVWIVVVFSVISSTIAAFSLPSQIAILPQIVRKDELQIANSITNVLTQGLMLIGPAGAGLTLAFLLESNNNGLFLSSESQELQVMGKAFLLDSATFFIAFALILRVSTKTQERTREDDFNLFDSIKSSMSFVTSDRQLFGLLGFFMVVGFITDGPSSIGLPSLAFEEFRSSVDVYGLFASCHSAGAIAGMVLAGFSRTEKLSFEIQLFSLAILWGLTFILVGSMTTISFVLIALVFMGTIDGILQILFITWLQNRTPIEMLGRVTSVMFFFGQILSPLSILLTGAVADYLGTSIMYMLCGTLLTSASLFKLIKTLTPN
ncbi:MAG: MFS transporter, partial [Pseudomonadales bacterium]|nr:MFS transporter [Pseudomonadales bacterium]